MNRIINPAQVKSAVVKIGYKKANGTAFFIDNNILVTAYHLFLDSFIEEESINIYLDGESEKKCKILYIDEENDICLLTCDVNHQTFLPLTEFPIRINENWESFGYPYQDEQQGVRFFGTVNQMVKNEKYDFILNSSNIESEYDYEGMSGSPVISAGRVVGIILKQLDNKIGAISINKISKLFNDNAIKVYEEELINEIPRQLEEDISDIISNYDVIGSLDKVIHMGGNWILLEGNPGTGKTVIVAAYTADEKCVVLGKYFTKVPNDEKPKSLRISKEQFFNWIEETISITVTGSLPAKSGDSLEVRVEKINGYFDELSEYLNDIDKIGLFFIDGLDEISDLESFLNIIPQSLPENIRFILSCTSRELLPISARNDIGSDRIIVVSPLDLGQCEYFIQKKVADKNIDYESIQKIAIKSEGHPLYLHYLIDYIVNSDISTDENELDIWIKKIPVIGGNIENYYKTIWEDIYTDSNKLWICLVLSQLRHSINEKELIEILPNAIRLNYYSVISKINHLIKGKKRLEIYHNSFKDFIQKQIPFYIQNCNDLIVKFCEEHPDNLYAITNVIYHHSLSSNPQNSVSSCDQNWADKLAVNHVEPDLIISDIKNVIELSIDLKMTTELLRLVLLLQRIDFRYNSILVEYAFEIALGLIANGEFKNALKYLVRRNVLLIGIRDAIHFLQHFHENEAYHEAAILKGAVEAEYRKLIDQGAKGSGVHHSTFIVKAQTIILSEGELKETQMELHEYLNLLKSRISSADPADDPESHFPAIKHIRDHCFAWNNAYLLRLYDNHFDLEEMMEVPNIKIDNSWAGLYATSLLIYRKEIDNYNLSNFNSLENDRRIVQDVEFLVEKFGYMDQISVRETLISALINNTSKPELLRKIMNEYLRVDQEFEIKNQNGVDFERFQYEKLSIRNNCLGFLDDSDGINLTKKHWLATTWEQDLNNLINEIHFIEGKFLYYKASNRLIEKSTLIKSKLKEIIKNSSFTFDFRSYWESSYLLPEEVFPLLFAKLIDLVYEFDYEGLDEYLELLKSKSNDQLGLYTEGFRKSLAKIVRSLLWLGYNQGKIEPIVEIWQSHVLSGVQNRWERTLELLKIYEIYGLLEQGEKADQVFQEILNSSMGPSWYKESQVTLINTAMENLKCISDSNTQEFASLLDHASGEMTFQRYVRHNKQDFIGSLIVNGKISKAIEYYKLEVLPTPSVLIRNAEISNFDAPRVGDGYCLGARNINEAGSILRILKTVDCNPYLKWALCQMFTISDDTFRYIDSFGEVLGSVLNEIEILDDANIDSICKVTSQLICSKDLDNDDRRSLLKSIFGNLSASNALILQKYLQEKNLKWNSDRSVKENTSSNLKDTKDKFDLYNESLAKRPAENNVEKKLNEGLDLYDIEKRSIWYNNHSNSLDLAKKNIKSLVLTENSVLEGLKPHVLSFDAEYWDICKELIWFLEGKLTGQQIDEIYRIIVEHFNYIIRPDQEIKQKYSWMNVEQNGFDVDGMISQLIIWHLNHPDSIIRNKTEENLQFLGSVYPQILEELFKECISNKPQKSVELSSLILKRISRKYAPLIKEMLSENRGILEEASHIPNLVVKKNLLEVGIDLNRIGFNDLYDSIKNTIPNKVILTGEVFFEEEHLVMIQDYIDDLNSELLLNEGFCKRLNHLVDEYCHPLSKSEVKKSDKYLRRSFYNEEGIPGRYNELLKHALNNAITSRVSNDNISKIFEIINS